MSRFQYRVYFRFLETRDEYFHHGAGLGRWRIYGIHLPDDVLNKVYYKNAAKLLPPPIHIWRSRRLITTRARSYTYPYHNNTALTNTATRIQHTTSR